MNYDNRQNDPNQDARAKLSSRNNSMFRIKKFGNAGNLMKHKKNDSISSESNLRQLRKVQKSMPRLDNSFGIFNSNAGNKNGVIDLNKTFDMIQKYNQQHKNNGTDHRSKMMMKNNRIQNTSKFKTYIKYFAQLTIKDMSCQVVKI